MRSRLGMTERAFEASGVLKRFKQNPPNGGVSHSDGELVAQPRQPEPDAALRRAQRDVRPLRDLGRGEPAPVGEHERLALRLGQLRERRADLRRRRGRRSRGDPSTARRRSDASAGRRRARAPGSRATGRAPASAPSAAGRCRGRRATGRTRAAGARAAGTRPARRPGPARRRRARGTRPRRPRGDGRRTRAGSPRGSPKSTVTATLYTMLKVHKPGTIDIGWRTPTASPGSTPRSSRSRRTAPTCTWAPCSSSKARRPTTTSSSRTSSAACTSSRATARSSRSRRSASRGRCGSTTRTSTPATTSATPRCRRRPATTSCGGSPAASSPSSSTARSRCGRSGSSTGWPTAASR